MVSDSSQTKPKDKVDVEKLVKANTDFENSKPDAKGTLPNNKSSFRSVPLSTVSHAAIFYLENKRFAGIPKSGDPKPSQRATDLKAGLSSLVEAINPSTKEDKIEKASARLAALSALGDNPLDSTEVSKALDWLISNPLRASMVNGIDDNNLLNYLRNVVFQ
jgi:uncharacterized membrane protein